MLLLPKFLNQFLKHRTSVLVLILSLLFSQFFIYFMYILDPVRSDPYDILRLPLGMVFLPSIIIIFIFGPLFLKYLTDFPYLRDKLLYNQNFMSNFKITLIKIIYFYILSLVTFLINWTITYIFYLNNLGSKAFFLFFLLGAFFLFFLTNLMILLHKFTLGFKTNILIFLFLIIIFFTFYSPNTIFAYYVQHWKGLELSKWFSFSKIFLPFYYLLFNFDLKDTIDNVGVFLGDLNKFLIILIGICSSGFALLTINLVSNNYLATFAKKLKAILLKK